MNKKRRLVDIIAETRNISKIRKSMQFITVMKEEIIEAINAGWKLNDIYVTLKNTYNYEYSYNIFISSIKRTGINNNDIIIPNNIDIKTIENVIRNDLHNEIKESNNKGNETNNTLIETNNEKRKPKLFTVEQKKFEYSNEKKL